LTSVTGSFVAVFNEHIAENISYISFTKSFLSAGLKVPEVISVSHDNTSYLVEDLGDITLHKFSYETSRIRLMELYAKALTDLVEFQTLGKEVIDFSKCCLSQTFDLNIIGNDVEKFTNYFLRDIAGFTMNAGRTEEIKKIFGDIVERNTYGHFMYRDFQPRNIMLHKDDLYYIDFQSGMKGPPQYDLVSFL
jgi:aminoglycoside/choline kinase family phosphotransferase